MFKDSHVLLVLLFFFLSLSINQQWAHSYDFAPKETRVIDRTELHQILQEINDLDLLLLYAKLYSIEARSV